MIGYIELWESWRSLFIKEKYPKKYWFYHETDTHRGITFWMYSIENIDLGHCTIEYNTGLLFEGDIPGATGSCGCKAIKSAMSDYRRVAIKRIDFFLDKEKLSEEIKKSLT